MAKRERTYDCTGCGTPYATPGEATRCIFSHKGAAVVDPAPMYYIVDEQDHVLAEAADLSAAFRRIKLGGWDVTTYLAFHATWKRRMHARFGRAVDDDGFPKGAVVAAPVRNAARGRLAGS